MHTPGTIHQGAGNGEGSIFTDTEGARRGNAGECTLSPLFIVNGQTPEDEANARRLVAAWNACAGISTEALEDGVIADTAADLAELRRQSAEMIDVKEAELQRLRADVARHVAPAIALPAGVYQTTMALRIRARSQSAAEAITDAAALHLRETFNDDDSIAGAACGTPAMVDDAEGAAPVAGRLEYLRGELRAERISFGELHELQSLAQHIEPGDVELLEAAGVPEHSDAAESGDDDGDIQTAIDATDERGQAIARAVEAATNAGALAIQQALGQTAGDLAGHFFDDANTDGMREVFGRYFDAEAIATKPRAGA